MAPRSPTRAFDPTPALEHNKNHFSPFDSSAMISVESHFPNASREVRFANPPVNSFTRAHSIATDNVPLLPQISSASQIPRQAFRTSNPGPGIDINAYIENCRNLNEQLRNAHETERRTWNIERAALKAQIADLEFKLNKSRDNRRRSSIETTAANPQALRSEFRAMHKAINYNMDAAPSTSESSSTAAGPSPFWRGPEHATPVTRVFSSEDSVNHHLPSISEDDSLPMLTREISPTSHVQSENVPIPIEKIEPTLDGITLKSAALNSSFVTKITSPQFGTPTRSPLQNAKSDASNMHIDTTLLLAPMDEKLKRHAGHTPMNFDGADVSSEISDQTTEVVTPRVEKPVEPASTARPPLRPSEGSDSYFSNVSDCDINERKDAFPKMDEDNNEQYEPEDDRPLRGPLMLDSSARSRAAESFLSSVDAKLMEAVKEVSPTRRESILSESAEGVMVPVTVLQSVQETNHQRPPPSDQQADDDMPRLKMKKSMNFGSAYGSNMPGWPR